MAKKKTKKIKKKTTQKKAAASRKKAGVVRGAAARKKARKTVAKKAVGKKAVEKKTAKTAIRERKRSPRLLSLDTAPESRGRHRGARGAGQSGDLQGLSRYEEADSESVEELLEEGQAFEAGIVGGVEDADGDPDEVHTKEVLEDDVPLEYLDKD
jgi:hypothetical protein